MISFCSQNEYPTVGGDPYARTYLTCIRGNGASVDEAGSDLRHRFGKVLHFLQRTFSGCPLHGVGAGELLFDLLGDGIRVDVLLEVMVAGADHSDRFPERS